MIGPKSKEKLEEFAKKFLIKAQQAMFENNPDKPEITQELVDRAVQAFVEGNNRMLYDFFDEEGHVITIYYYPEWSYTIECVKYSENEYVSRSECEKAAFEQAFKLLENGGN